MTPKRALGRLRVSTAMHAADKREKGVKTDRPREVPVHPTLAKVLATWKLSGWPLYFDRAPGPDDLIVPSRKGSPRSVAHMLKKFHEDLARLGLRPRRQHDARRTFISLARADGARPDVLRWVSHGPTGFGHGRLHDAALGVPLRCGGLPQGRVEDRRSGADEARGERGSPRSY